MNTSSLLKQIRECNRTKELLPKGVITALMEENTVTDMDKTTVWSAVMDFNISSWQC